MKVVEETVPEASLYPARRAHEQVPPDIPEETDEQGETENLQSVDEESGRRDLSGGQIVDGELNDSWNKKLKHIHDQQRRKPSQDPPPVLFKIAFKDSECIHFRISMHCKKEIDSFQG